MRTSLNMVPTVNGTLPESPFGLADDNAYKIWRERKLRDYPDSFKNLMVNIATPESLTSSEKTALLQVIAKTNFALFQCATPEKVTKATIARLGSQLGLQHIDENLCADEDKISSITVDHSGSKNTYIPYTNRPISWHTDGYYNDLPGHAVKSFILYCAQNAGIGGTNRLMDQDLAYIHLRDSDPKLVEALSHPQAMTIPANIVDGIEIREEQTGPVFLWDEQGHLYMRYTARTRSIQWRQDEITRHAVAKLAELFASDHPGIFEHTLQPGQGVISNNILHMRTGFEDREIGKQRLFFRARYYQRINTSALEQTPC